MTLPNGWLIPDWPAAANVRAFITTRGGGVSTGDFASFNLGDLTEDDPAAVAENKRRLRQWLPSEPRWLRQVHGARVVCADTVESPVPADAAFTTTHNVVCAIKIADCMPVMFCDVGGHVVGVAHAGWRGLQQGVLENTVAALGVPPRELLVFLGPVIGPQAFEVGEDVHAAFCAEDHAAETAFAPLGPGKWLADLPALARQRLARRQITRVYGARWCTYSDPLNFYSHRRNPRTGRMAALIWLQARAN